MKYLFATIISVALALLPAIASAQGYQYSVDLNDVTDDQLTVNLICPEVKTDEIKFYLPRIVPGTYMNSNYGKYVHDLKAFDKNGKELKVKKDDDNSWSIKSAKTLHHLSYRVEDTWDSEIKNKVYPMAGTNFEAGKNFVINPPGLFGYFEGLRQTSFSVKYLRPARFYAATGLKPAETTAAYDLFNCKNADELYDSPVMFSVPDTTTIKVGEADVLIAVYSPNKLATAKFIASHLTKLLQGTKRYLKGKLPVDKYAFLFYFNGEQRKFTESGAWEHSFSSFYSLEEEKQETAIKSWVDMAAHEFFHIVTPLTISAKEVKEFNFNETHLSKHVWLYEGSTEYASHHMQVWSGLRTPEQFLEELETKIRYSRLYFKDDLPFTELSIESAGKWKDQYVNVYLKGALLSACLDLYLLKASGGQYGMRDLKHDLGVKYGKDKYFNDAELFDEIAKLTYPGIRSFFSDYIEGAKPVPYEEYFGYAGINYFPTRSTESPSTGGIQVVPDSAGNLVILIDKLSPFGKTLGIKPGDQLVTWQGKKVTQENLDSVLRNFERSARPGSKLEIGIRRPGGNGLVKLNAIVTNETKHETHILRIDPNATPAQLMIRKAWFGNREITTGFVADSADVSSVDNVINALYAVISGPAGQRNWSRFRSLFYPDAFMMAVTEQRTVYKFTPEQYVPSNHPFFMKHSFEEKELSRKTNRFGNIAQVFTTYEYVAGTEPPEKAKGINSVELIFDKGRWWITAISWDEAAPDRPIPSQYLTPVAK